MKPQPILVAAMMAAALLMAGCGRSGTGAEESTANKAVSSDFGDLKGVCQPGKTTSSPTQGVTADQIQVGVFSDIGFTQNPEYVNTAKAFTSWCNANGGINGRKLTYTIHDTKMMQVRQGMLDACRTDFALVGGSAALDALGVRDRLSCTLPEFPAQMDMTENSGSDLQIGGGVTSGLPYDAFTGLHTWLAKEAYPDSASAIGIITGDSPVSKPMASRYAESLPTEGSTVVYNDLYPAMGVSDWTPYAQSIKAKGVKGLIFLGDFRSLAKLEDILTGMDYKLDWIDTNSNAYGPDFIKLAGGSLTGQNNYADLSGTAPLDATGNAAVKQAKDLFAKYAPGQDLTYPALRSFTEWLVFAKAAASCGDNLTRTCVYDAARKETAWTAGGLQAPADLSGAPGAMLKCFDAQRATPQGWKAADFKPDNGLYRCDINPYVYKGDYGKPMTLADVGKTMADVK